MRIKRTRVDDGLSLALRWVGVERVRRCARVAGGHHGGDRFFAAAVLESRSHPVGTDEREKAFGLLMIALTRSAADIRRALRRNERSDTALAARLAEEAGDPPVERWAAEAALGED